MSGQLSSDPGAPSRVCRFRLVRPVEEILSFSTPQGPRTNERNRGDLSSTKQFPEPSRTAPKRVLTTFLSYRAASSRTSGRSSNLTKAQAFQLALTKKANSLLMRRKLLKVAQARLLFCQRSALETTMPNQTARKSRNLPRRSSSNRQSSSYET